MPGRDAVQTVDLRALKVACKHCNLFQLCLLAGLAEADLALLESIIERGRLFRRGDHLFQVGERFRVVCAVKSGSVKTYFPLDGGGEQVVGFHLPGELLGLDAINAETHQCNAKALGTTSVCELPFDRLEGLASVVKSVQRQMVRIMSKQISYDQAARAIHGKRHAEGRLAAFLLNLSTRFEQRGFSPLEFNLAMSRLDIGSYLGLAEETVSRLFTRFQKDGVVAVQRKYVCIRDLDRLRVAANGSYMNGAAARSD